MIDKKEFVAITFKDTALKADVPNANGIVYPKEILEKAVKQIEQLGFGVIHESTITTRKEDLDPCVSDYAFSIKDVEFNDPNLDITIKTIDTSKGRLASEMLESDENIGPFSIGIAGHGKTEILDNGNLVEVTEFNCQRVSLLPKKDKA